MTDDIQVGLLYILGHIHAPTPEQVPVLPCGLPGMPSREAIQKLHTITLACDWIHDQIEKNIAVEEEQVQKAQESLPFVEVESTPESFHEENGAAMEAGRDWEAENEQARDAYIRAKLNLDPSEPTPKFSDNQWSAMKLARDYVIRGDRSFPAEEAYRLWGSHPLTGFVVSPALEKLRQTLSTCSTETLDFLASFDDSAPAIKVPQVVKRKSRSRKSIYVMDRHYGRVVYKTLSHAARAYNLNEEAVRSRVKRGWTIEQALEIDVAPRGVVIKTAGEEGVYKNLAAACRANNVSYASVQARIKKGESPGDAICALRIPLPRVRL